MDLSNFKKFKESSNYIVYLEKEPKNKDNMEMIVYYKAKGSYWKCILTDAIFKLFFNPEEYKRIYMKNIIDKNNGK